MKAVLVSILLLSSVVFCGFFAIFGVDITGHVFPFVGVGYSLESENFVATFGLTYDFKNPTWIFANSLRYFHEFSNVKLGMNLTAIFADRKILYLVGPEVGYSFDLDFGKIYLGGRAMMTLPFGAVDEIKGPVPVIDLTWKSD